MIFKKKIAFIRQLRYKDVSLKWLLDFQMHPCIPNNLIFLDSLRPSTFLFLGFKEHIIRQISRQVLWPARSTHGGAVSRIGSG